MQTENRSELIQRLIKAFKENLINKGYSRRTSEVYAAPVQQFLEKVNDPKLPTEEEARAHISEIAGESSESLSASTIGIAVSAIRSYFRLMLGKELTPPVERSSRRRPLPVILKKDEIQSIINVTRNVTHRLMFQLMYSSGLKLDELLTLKVKDVDLARKKLAVHAAPTAGRRAGITREAILSEKVAPMLHAFLTDRNPDDYVFPGLDGKIMSPRAVQKAFKNAAIKAGITKRVSCSTLRHSFAVHLLEKGIDIRHVRRLLGHSRAETSSIYKRMVNPEKLYLSSPLDM
ncbi:MAG: tyrosine-type recombinase/integrase [bacterium]